ncbi:hypothetical protein ABKN59_007025 [Abortiporus biennis]
MCVNMNICMNPRFLFNTGKDGQRMFEVRAAMEDGVRNRSHSSFTRGSRCQQRDAEQMQISFTPPPTLSCSLSMAEALDDTLGALLIGVFFAATLYGISCIQTYSFYMDTKKKDSRYLQGLVALLWTMNTVDTVCVAHVAYYFTITNYGKPVTHAPWTVAGFNVLANLNDFFIRAIFIYRILRVSRKMWLAIVLWMANLTVSGFGFALSIQVEIIGDLNKIGRLSWLIITLFTWMAFADTIIAIVLCIILWQLRTGFNRTDSQIETLMKYSIHTGALTSVVAVVIVITYAVMPHNFVYIAVYLTLPKLYHNALLATLNARDHLRAEMDGGSGMSSVHVSKLLIADPSRWGVGSSGSRTAYSKDTQFEENELVSLPDRTGSNPSSIIMLLTCELNYSHLLARALRSSGDGISTIMRPQ